MNLQSIQSEIKEKSISFYENKIFLGSVIIGWILFGIYYSNVLRNKNKKIKAEEFE
jgi:hypothetical protein